MNALPPRPYLRPDWLGCTAIVVAGGPSLSDAQLATVSKAHHLGLAKTVAVNNTCARMPWANVAYFNDYMAVKHYRPKLSHCCDEWVTADRAAAERFRLTHIKSANTNGITLQRVHLNGNSGAAALNMAACFGASRILLVGFDMKADKTGKLHHFGSHPSPLVQVCLFDEWIKKFNTIASDAKKLGIEVVNCSIDTALECFPRATLEECLPW